MKGKIWFLIPALLLLTCVGVLAVDSSNVTLTWISPAVSSTLSGTANLLNFTANITGSTTAGGLNITSINVTVGGSTICTNTTGVLNIQGRFTVPCFADTAVQPDGNTITYTVTAYNATGVAIKSTTRVFKIDNTRPVPAITTAANTRITDGSTVTITETNVNSSDTSAILYFDNGNYFTLTETSTGYTRTFNFGDLPDGAWDAWVVATDGTNISTSAKINLITAMQQEKNNKGGINNDAQIQQAAQQQATKNNNLTTVLVIVGVLGLVLYLNKQGKGRR